MKKVLIQNNEQLELVREEIRVSSLFSHPNLLPLLDHAIISVKVTTVDCSSCLLYILLLFCSLIKKKKIIAILSFTKILVNLLDSTLVTTISGL